jgi:hypothetical protein
MTTEGKKTQRKTKKEMDRWGKKGFGNTGCDELRRYNPESGRIENNDDGSKNY